MSEQKKYRVIVSNSAAQMLVSHATFLAQVNIEAAERLADEFEKTAASLETMPLRCPWLSGDYIPVHKYRYILFGRHYAILYQIIDDVVYADYVVDFRQEYGWLFR